MFDPHLSGTEDVSGAVQTQLHGTELEDFAVVDSVRGHIHPQALAQNRQAIALCPVMAHAGAGMVAMAMGDDGASHLAPGIDVEVAGRAIQAVLV